MRRVGLLSAVAFALVVAAAAMAATSGWKVQPSPNPGGAMDSQLFGVSCASSRTCTAVGDSTKDFTVFSTLAERWTGTKWSIQHTPTPGGTYGDLYAVSCAGAKTCISVGDYEPSGTAVVALAERFNGKKWSVLHPLNPAGASGSALRGVSCISARACTAVGDYTNAGVDQTLVQRWNGKVWAIKRTPNPSGANLSVLNAVTCTSRSACTAVGTSRNGSAVYTTLTERWNGTKWSINPSPNPAGSQHAELDSVSCTAAGGCIAVGSYQKKPSHSRTLAERWNGKKWSIQHTVNPTTDPNKFLLGVSCTSRSACTAVGYTSGPIVWQATLVEHWNGSKWSVERSPHPGTDSQLHGLSCVSTSTCTAVGLYEKSSGGQKTLVEHR
ncbi:MAG TPA: hypothetical protein VGL78_14510 [Solirubrobacteraceae bacterium]|jgi:hypothetical protein